MAIDMTARDLQAKAKAKGLPWSAAKGFDTFTPIRQAIFILLRLASPYNANVFGLFSDFIPKSAISDPQNVDLWLKVNDKIKQSGNTKDMIFE